jgi:hypothetical protein
MVLGYVLPALLSIRAVRLRTECHLPASFNVDGMRFLFFPHVIVNNPT